MGCLPTACSGRFRGLLAVTGRPYVVLTCYVLLVVSFLCRNITIAARRDFNVRRQQDAPLLTVGGDDEDRSAEDASGQYAASLDAVLIADRDRSGFRILLLLIQV